MFLDAQKNLLIETVLLSIHNICFCREIRKLMFWYVLLTKGLAFALSVNYKQDAYTNDILTVNVIKF